MHRPPSQYIPLSGNLPRPNRARNGGFSLVEVTLAIGIIAFAFVALFGLLPTGMQTFRASVDSTNDITIMQEMNAMVQVTRWKYVDKLDANNGGDTYYFDEEGRRTDTKATQSDAKEVRARRLYQVKLLVEDSFEPGVSSRTPDKTKMYKDAKRIVVIVGDLRGEKSQAEKDFRSVTKSTELRKGLAIRSRTFMIARMDSERDLDTP